MYDIIIDRLVMKLFESSNVDLIIDCRNFLHFSYRAKSFNVEKKTLTWK